MRFQEKIHEGKVSRFAVLYGGHSFRSAVAEAGKLGVRDVFYFRQRDHPGEGVDLLYYDYEQFDFGLLDRWLNPSWKREHGSTPPPNASEERARLGHEVRDRLFDRRTRYELALPYRVGPLCFLQEPKRGLEPIFWQAEPDFLMEMVRSVAGYKGTQIVFFPDYDAAWGAARKFGESGRVVGFLDCHREGRAGLKALRWENKKERINLVSPGNTRMYRFCVCDLAEERVFWVRYESGP